MAAELQNNQKGIKILSQVLSQINNTENQQHPSPKKKEILQKQRTMSLKKKKRKTNLRHKTSLIPHKQLLEHV